MFRLVTAWILQLVLLGVGGGGVGGDSICEDIGHIAKDKLRGVAVNILV